MLIGQAVAMSESPDRLDHALSAENRLQTLDVEAAYGTITEELAVLSASAIKHVITPGRVDAQPRLTWGKLYQSPSAIGPMRADVGRAVPVRFQHRGNLDVGAVSIRGSLQAQMSGVTNDVAVKVSGAQAATMTARASGNFEEIVLVGDTLSTAIASAAFGAAPASNGPLMLPFGYLSTHGNQIVSNSTGADVRIAAINWFGMEVGGLPTGLQSSSYTTMMNQMKANGFNTIRLAYSDQGLTDISGNWAANPALAGKSGLQIMDAIVSYAGQIGMKVILDHHRSADGSAGNANGLWYDPSYIVNGHAQTQQDWINGLVSLSEHYAGNSTVVGMDLANEPFAGQWGGGGSNDWVGAATLAGNAIAAANPNLLIIVEGTYSYGGALTEYGENLMGVATTQVLLTNPNKVVYSPHVYPYSIVPYPAGTASEQMSYLTQTFGYIYQNNIAPLFVGEYGSSNSAADLAWESTLAAYLNNPGGVPSGGQGISSAYWAWSISSGSSSDPSLLTAAGTPDPAILASIAPNFYYSPANCFATGTRILTTRGEVAVEHLTTDHFIPTQLGDSPARVQWLGRRRVDCSKHSDLDAVHPVRIAKGAFADSVPARDLFLSPEHAIYLDNVLVPIRCLLNGSTIAQVAVTDIVYWSVELPWHDVILAEGLAAESYLNTNDHDGFDNAPPDRQTLSRASAAYVWAAKGCADIVEGGPLVEAIRTRLKCRARAILPA